MINLKDETLEMLEGYAYTVEDIEWVGSEEYEIPVDRFFELADQEYDNGYGSEKVCTDLVISMKDGSWFERDNYDGSEWWKHMAPTRRPKKRMDNVKTVFSKGYDTWLGECNV